MHYERSIVLGYLSIPKINWGLFRSRFGDHFRVGDHFGVGICTDTIIAKERYTTSLPTLISTTGLSLQVWCLGRVYPFSIKWLEFFLRNSLNMGGGGGEKREKGQLYCQQ